MSVVALQGFLSVYSRSSRVFSGALIEIALQGFFVVVLVEGLTPFTQAKNISRVSCFFYGDLVLRGVPTSFPKTMIQVCCDKG